LAADQSQTEAGPCLNPAGLLVLAGQTELGQALLEIVGQERRSEQVFDGMLLPDVADLVQRVGPFVRREVAAPDPGEREQLPQLVVALRLEEALQLLEVRVVGVGLEGCGPCRRRPAPPARP
jgi:hypothetical protein